MLAGVGVVSSGSGGSWSRGTMTVILGIKIVEDLGFGDGRGRRYVEKVVLGLAGGVGV